jgi:hypothetical protein
MAISVLDVRETFAPARVRVLPVEVPATTTDAVTTPATVTVIRRMPVTIAAAGLIGILEAVALLAVGLWGLDYALTTVAPSGWLVAAGLITLAGWIVLGAGSAAALIDGAGRRLLMGVAFAEIALVSVSMIVATLLPFPLPTDIPVPAWGVLGLVLPVGKLLLVGAPSARGWIAAGPRLRERRPDPVQAHRLLATVTLGIIGLSLGAVAVLTPVQGGGISDPASVVYSQP